MSLGPALFEFVLCLGFGAGASQALAELVAADAYVSQGTSAVLVVAQ